MEKSVKKHPFYIGLLAVVGLLLLVLGASDFGDSDYLESFSTMKVQKLTSLPFLSGGKYFHQDTIPMILNI